VTATVETVRAELITAAWAAWHARRAHGDASVQYGRALVAMEAARRVFECALELERST